MPIRREQLGDPGAVLPAGVAQGHEQHAEDRAKDPDGSVLAFAAATWAAFAERVKTGA
jgi:hypothetical protein